MASMCFWNVLASRCYGSYVPTSTLPFPHPYDVQTWMPLHPPVPLRLGLSPRSLSIGSYWLWVCTHRCGDEDGRALAADERNWSWAHIPHKRNPFAASFRSCMAYYNTSSLLLKYVATYTPKFSDSFSKNPNTFSVARRVLFDHLSAEPEMMIGWK
eukprot:6468913-Amphidinium_carterae.1